MSVKRYCLTGQAKPDTVRLGYFVMGVWHCTLHAKLESVIAEARCGSRKSHWLQSLGFQVISSPMVHPILFNHCPWCNCLYMCFFCCQVYLQICIQTLQNENLHLLRMLNDNLVALIYLLCFLKEKINCLVWINLKIRMVVLLGSSFPSHYLRYRILREILNKI